MTARALRDAYGAGTARPSEVVEAALDRIAALDGRLHAFLHLEAEQARAEAAEWDQRYARAGRNGDLPPLELGVGVAFQDSAPSLWMDADSRIMISRALNLSDRLSSCSKMAKRLFQSNPAPFNVYLLQTLMDDAVADEGEELLVRYNLNGIELNEEGFQKLSAEISLAPMGGNFPLPWGKERVQLYFGEVPLGESLEPVVIRKGFVRQLLPGGKIGAPGNRAYYEVCTDAKLLDLARRKVSASAPRS
jgi:hypothetical protein